MAIDGIYMNDNRITTNTAIGGKDASELGMDDFMNLLVAQMTNQDMLNPTNDTEFIAQMAQFASLQGIQTLQEYQLSSYASSYAGKYVTIANQTSSGSLETITGKVEAVTFYDGSPKVIVDGKSYDLHTVMEVSDSAGAGTLAEASKYIGQKVTVTYKNDMDVTREFTGIVTGVTIKDNEPHLIIQGEGEDGEKREFPLSSLKTVDSEDKTDTPSDGTGSESGSDNTSTGDAAARAFSGAAGGAIQADTSERDGDIDRSGSENWTSGVNTRQVYSTQIPLSALGGNLDAEIAEELGIGALGTVDPRKEINDMGADSDNWPKITYSSARSYERVPEINDMGGNRTVREGNLFYSQQNLNVQNLSHSEAPLGAIDRRKEINDMGGGGNWPEITYSSARSYERVPEINDMGGAGLRAIQESSIYSTQQTLESHNLENGRPEREVGTLGAVDPRKELNDM